jgi:N-methylhydantoinase A
MYEISVDTGGTFTDVVVSDGSGKFVIGKALTTPGRAFDGMSAAIGSAADLMGLTSSDLIAKSARLIYGTTRATNAIVTRKTARTALLINDGFRDVLTIREGGKADPHDFTARYPEPYVPKTLTFGVTGRINAEGGVEASLDEARILEIIGELKARKVEAIGVCLLWSVVNPVHEKRIGEMLAEALPGVPFTLSHQLLPILREYRRALACSMDASLKPLMQKHLQEMETDLRGAGFSGDILVSTTIGGSMEVARMSERPVHMVKSGPAMAPVAAWEYASRETDAQDVIVCDTGGTTFDVGLIRGREIVRTRETWLGPKYSGELLALSSVDIRSVGAGGGSIAWIDAGGLLHVGPESAGSEPGPACYGRGGTRATVTDAAVVAGYIDPELFLGGRMKLDATAARDAVGQIASELSLTVEEAALAIITVANDRMISAIQDITVSEGIDPRESAFVAGGGAAGLNIVAIAAELGCKTIILPRTASALSACGMQFSDVVSEESGSLITSSDAFDFAGVAKLQDAIESDLRHFQERLNLGGVVSHRIEYAVEARYRSQVWEIEVGVPVGRIATSEDLAALVEAFHAQHERNFAVRDPNSVVEFLTWKARLHIAIDRGQRPNSVTSPIDAAPLPLKTSPAFFQDSGFHQTPFYMGDKLRPGTTVPGPAIVLEATTTIVLPPGSSATLTAQENYLITTGA